MCSERVHSTLAQPLSRIDTQQDPNKTGARLTTQPNPTRVLMEQISANISAICRLACELKLGAIRVRRGVEASAHNRRIGSLLSTLPF